MGRIIMTLFVLSAIGVAGWIIWMQLMRSPAFRRLVLREDSHDTFISDATSMRDEAEERKEISESAREKLRADEDKLKDIFPGGKTES